MIGFFCHAREDNWISHQKCNTETKGVSFRCSFKIAFGLGTWIFEPILELEDFLQIY